MAYRLVSLSHRDGSSRNLTSWHQRLPCFLCENSFSAPLDVPNNSPVGGRVLRCPEKESKQQQKKTVTVSGRLHYTIHCLFLPIPQFVFLTLTLRFGMAMSPFLLPPPASFRAAFPSLLPKSSAVLRSSRSRPEGRGRATRRGQSPQGKRSEMKKLGKLDNRLSIHPTLCRRYEDGDGLG